MPLRSLPSSQPSPRLSSALSSKQLQLILLAPLWAAIYAFSLASPPLLDDADATHAQAAQAMLRSGDWVTLHVNGIRYLEKPPLPYWLTAISLRLFGNTSFAVHLPLALTVLGLAALAWMWGNRAFHPAPGSTATTLSQTAGFYAALFTLTSTGVFLFTRIFIPDALLSLLLALTLFAALRALESNRLQWAAVAWTALGLAVLTKGLVALVFIFGAMALYLPLSGEARHWRRLRPLAGIVLLLAVAAPWHILAGLRNRGGLHGHGFFWFYFINEHVLRFLGRRSPPDYNKLPALLYWSLHLVWLFPWSFFAPALAAVAWRTRGRWHPLRRPRNASFASRSTLLLAIFSALVLVFFSLSTNQEYYTFPIYLPVLLLTAAAMVKLEQPSHHRALERRNQQLLLLCHGALTIVALLAALALAFGLWSSRHLPPATDIGDLFAHRGVAGYTLSMSHFFDLTTASFSALRLPTAIACAALAILPLFSLFLRARRKHLASTVSIALMSSAFLVAAHIALVRFTPLLSSHGFALQIQRIEDTEPSGHTAQILIYGDQAFGSSIPFYLRQRVYLVDGRSTSMLFGSTFPDAPPIFLTSQQLSAQWGHGPRRLLFVPLDERPAADHLLGSRAILLYESSGRALYTDRPLTAPKPVPLDSAPSLPNNR